MFILVIGLLTPRTVRHADRSNCIQISQETDQAPNVNSNASLTTLHCNVKLPVLRFACNISEPFKSSGRENLRVITILSLRFGAETV